MDTMNAVDVSCPACGQASGVKLPNAAFQPAYAGYAAWELVAILLAGLVVAVAAAMIPVRWAARTNVVEVLHAE